MPVAQLVEHLTFNQGVRDSNSRGRTKKHQTNFVRCFFVVSFKILNIVIPFWLLSPLFIFSRSSPPHPEQVGEDPVDAGAHHGREQCPGQHHPMAICPSICRVPGIHSLSAGGCLLLISPIPTTNTVPPCRGFSCLRHGALLYQAIVGLLFLFWQAVCPRPTANPMRRRQGRGTRSGRTAGTRWG